jgi:hypothetical protein
VGLLADDGRVEDADDAHSLVGVPRDPVAVGGTDAVQNAGFEGPLLAGAAILEHAAAGTHVVRLPVVLVPEIYQRSELSPALALASETLKPTPSDLVSRRTADDFPWEMVITRPCDSSSVMVRMSMRASSS